MKITYNAVKSDDIVLESGDMLVLEDTVDNSGLCYALCVFIDAPELEGYTLVKLGGAPRAEIQEFYDSNHFNRSQLIFNYYKIVDVIASNRIEIVIK